MDHKTHGDSLWSPVFEARNYAEAGMVKGLLEGAGMPVRLESVLGIPHLGFSGRVTVSVPAQDEAKGAELIAAYFGLPACGEENEDPPCA